MVKKNTPDRGYFLSKMGQHGYRPDQTLMDKDYRNAGTASLGSGGKVAPPRNDARPAPAKQNQTLTPEQRLLDVILHPNNAYRKALEAKNIGGNSDLSDKYLNEDGALKRLGLRGYVTLDDLSDEDFVLYALKRSANSAAVASGLRTGLAGEFNHANAPEASAPQAPIPSQSTDRPSWRNQEGASCGPVEFIKGHFGEMRDGEWHHLGIVRSDLKTFKGLYSSYASWINRYPGEALTFADGTPPGRPRKLNADENRRIRDREAKARRTNRDVLTRYPL